MRAGPIQIVELALEAGHSLSFEAGQYVHVRHPSGTRIPFTIATAPHSLPNLQIHFQAVAGNADSALMQEVIASGEVELEDTQGSVTLLAAQQPQLLFICAGSGFAQANSLISAAIHLNHPAKRTLLWFADSPVGFYAHDLLEMIRPSTATHLVVDSRRDQSNAGMRWLRGQASGLASSGIILCGSPTFVYAATDVLKEAGVSGNQMHSDVYAYAPR